jgi:peptidoglycan-N-acetylglucosamine deacetylase
MSSRAILTYRASRLHRRSSIFGKSFYYPILLLLFLLALAPSERQLQAQPQPIKTSILPTYAKFFSGNPHRKQIALTFDDGPHRYYTQQLLAILKEQNVRATFFIVGEKAEQYPELVRAEVAAGHCIGNHTYNHLSLTDIPDEYIPLELSVCDDILKRLTGKSVHLFRPPGGKFNSKTLKYATEAGYTTILWTANSGDYSSPGAKVIQTRVLGQVSNGGIILFHDGIPQTMQILPELIRTLRTRGYEFVTVEELMQQK